MCESILNSKHTNIVNKYYQKHNRMKNIYECKLIRGLFIIYDFNLS